MKIFYKCTCMSAEGSFEVRDREEGEDVIDWMKGAVEPSLAAAHTSVSPRCRAASCEYVKIPAPENAPFIGGKPVLNS